MAKKPRMELFPLRVLPWQKQWINQNVVKTERGKFVRSAITGEIRRVKRIVH